MRDYRTPKPFAFASGVAGVLLMAGALLATPLGIERFMVLQPYHIKHAAGRHYVFELERPSAPFEIVTDKATDGPPRSRLLIKEDGRPLGPAHATLQDVERRGDGRYRHLDDFVHFSTSDNSDPMTNGRFYHAVYMITLAPLAAWLTLTTGTFMALGGLLVLNRRQSRGGAGGAHAPLSALDDVRYAGTRCVQPRT